jgi:hypothetical protein
VWLVVCGVFVGVWSIQRHAAEKATIFDAVRKTPRCTSLKAAAGRLAADVMDKTFGRA